PRRGPKDSAKIAEGIWQRCEHTEGWAGKTEQRDFAKKRGENSKPAWRFENVITAFERTYRLGRIAPSLVLCYGFCGGCYGGQCGFQGDVFPGRAGGRSAGWYFVCAKVRRRDTRFSVEESRRGQRLRAEKSPRTAGT